MTFILADSWKQKCLKCLQLGHSDIVWVFDLRVVDVKVVDRLGLRIQTHRLLWAFSIGNTAYHIKVLTIFTIFILPHYKNIKNMYNNLIFIYLFHTWPPGSFRKLTYLVRANQMFYKMTVCSSRKLINGIMVVFSDTKWPDPKCWSIKNPKPKLLCQVFLFFFLICMITFYFVFYIHIVLMLLFRILFISSMFLFFMPL